MSDKYLAIFVLNDVARYSPCSDYDKAVTSCLASIIENIDTIEDESLYNRIVSDIVNNRATDAVDEFIAYHKERNNQVNVGFVLLDKVDAESKYEKDCLDSFKQGNMKWTE